MKQNIALKKEQMQILIDKGLDCSNATFSYEYGCESNLSIKGEHGASSNDISAFSLQDMLDIMPDFINASYRLKIQRCMCSMNDSMMYYISYEYGDECKNVELSNNILYAAYYMLLWLIDNGHVKVDKGC